MLKSIGAKCLKGLEFDRDLGEKTIIMGLNGSGKTAILTAISLLSLGYQPGASKKLIDILNNITIEDKLQIYGQFENIHLYRRYLKTKAGAKQDYMVNRRKAKRDDFVTALSKTPKVIDLYEFNDMSDDKKFDYLINLYGDTKELNLLYLELSELKEKRNLKTKKLTAQNATVENLVKAQADLEIPAGTLAEIRQEIEKIEAEYQLTVKNLATAKAQQELKKAEAARAEAREAARAEKEKTKVEPQPETNKHTVAEYATTSADRDPQVNDVEYVNEFGDPVNPPKTQTHINTAAAATSIQKILDTMAKGCNLTCAAKIVARIELKKYV